DDDADDAGSEEGDGGSPDSTKASSAAAAAAAALERSMPEYVLPYAIHLLAYHPDFPVHKDDKQRIKNMEKCLNFLIEPLIGAGRQTGEADNMSMLLQMLDTITASYRDALDPSNNRIHLTARIARQLLLSKIKTQSDLQ
ncbi:unnamed protein product, partial [Ectocarpus sp. 8 AP-2014]